MVFIPKTKTKITKPVSTDDEIPTYDEKTAPSRGATKRDIDNSYSPGGHAPVITQPILPSPIIKQPARPSSPKAIPLPKNNEENVPVPLKKVSAASAKKVIAPKKVTVKSAKKVVKKIK